MTTIAELKAEVENLLFRAFDCEGINNSNSKVAFMQVQINRVLELLPLIEQSLSDEIDEDVGKCEGVVDNIPFIDGGNGKPIFCRNVPPEQKCEGCKRLLRFQRENL